MQANSKWAVSRNFDLLFFVLPVLLGLFYFWLVAQIPAYALPITILVWMIFAQGHFGSTWFIYFDKKNQAHYSTKYITYYIIPAFIFAVVLAIGVRDPVLLYVLIAIVSFYHVSKQSVGILQLYRVRNKEFNVTERYAEMAAIFAWGLTFASYGAMQLPMFADIFGSMLGIIRYGVYMLCVCAILLTVYILVCFIRRNENSLPKNLFLAVSVLLYLPYVYTPSLMLKTNVFEIATLTSLIPHYMQYMGLVWLINKNKYAPGTTFGTENPMLARISGRVVYILGIIMAYAALMGYLYFVAPQYTNVLSVAFPAIVSGFMMIHFYIDAFIWRFKDPHIRETVLPFVRPLEASH